MSIAEKVRLAKERKSAPKGAIDKWIAGDKQRLAKLNEYLTAFAAERSHRFGWQDLVVLLSDEFPDFAGSAGMKRESLRRWAETNHPDFAPGGGRTA